MGRPVNKNRNSGFYQVLGNYERGAKTRGHAWELTEKEFYDLTQEPCAYCGVRSSKSAPEKYQFFDYNGIDRVDNAEGYFIDNCVPCCTECNLMKRKLSLGEFLEKIEDIYYYSSLFLR